MSMWVSGGLAVASMAVSVAGQNSAASAAGKSQTRSLNAQNMASVAENEAIVKSNLNSQIRTSYKAGMMNMQLGLRKKQMIQEGHAISVQKEQVLSAANVNAAAAGSIGSSVDAVVTDIQMKSGEAQAQQRENYNQELTNFNSDLEALSLNAEGSVQRAHPYQNFGSPSLPSSGQIWGSALMSGAQTFMSLYGSKRMNLDLGSSTQSQATLNYGALYGPSVVENI